MHSVERTALGGVRLSSLAERRDIDLGDPAPQERIPRGRTDSGGVLPDGAGCCNCTLQGQSFVLLPVGRRTWGVQRERTVSGPYETTASLRPT